MANPTRKMIDPFFSLFFLGKLAPEFLRQTVLLGKTMLALGAIAVVFGVISYFHKSV